MIAHTIRAAKGCARVDSVLVSTEDKEIASVAEREGALVVPRPAQLAQDSSPTEPCILHAMDWWLERNGEDPAIVVLLQPTSPLRDSTDIEQAFTIYDRAEADCLLSVVERREFHWEEREGLGNPKWDIRNRPRRQELAPDLIENGAIYITKSSVYREQGNRLGGRIALYRMPPERSIDVDEPFDLLLAGMLLEKRKERK
ncbi:MAG: N-acylneuraminate cytidylyltransferase [bacterium]|nr:N-acylneuraminate cytidylyltransferase [bacterium]